MTTPYSCDQFAERLVDLIDREIDETTRASMEAHAVACGNCGPLVADLRNLRLEAANMPELEPSRDLWTGIAARIETPVVELKHGGAVARWRGGTQRRAALWYGLAAAGLVAITATVTHELTKRELGSKPSAAIVANGSPSKTGSTGATASPIVGTESATTKRVASSVDSVPPYHRTTVPPSRARLVSSRLSAEQTYDAEIAQLRAVLQDRRPQLDSTTVVVVEKNLKIIDDAIAQCRRALRKDPASRFLLESLNDALDTKVQLLRTAVSLPSRS